MSDGTTLDVVGMSAASASPSSLDDEDVGASREIALGPKDPPRVPRREEDWEGESSRAAWDVTLMARGARRHAGRERRDGTTRCAAETAAVSALMVRTRRSKWPRGDSRGKSEADCVKRKNLYFTTHREITADLSEGNIKIGITTCNTYQFKEKTIFSINDLIELQAATPPPAGQPPAPCWCASRTWRSHSPARQSPRASPGPPKAPSPCSPCRTPGTP